MNEGWKGWEGAKEITKNIKTIVLGVLTMYVIFITYRRVYEEKSILYLREMFLTRCIIFNHDDFLNVFMYT